jgi:hypothetical protein
MSVRGCATWVIGFGWITAILCGFWSWERYDTTPGRMGPSVPTDRAAPARWRLTVFAHPKCPCTRATLSALAGLVRAAPELGVRIVFSRPGDGPPDWERGENWDAATRLGGADLVCDPDGAEARRFGAETSGQAVLTNPDGRVVFRGGLTPARGRTGDSAGHRAVLAWMRTGCGAADAPVYGCPLFATRE